MKKTIKKIKEQKISVVMSTYSEPLKWITESIDSILNQTFKDFEFIIINDNPKRKELQEFLEKYRKQDKRIILIKNKKNSGPAIARNNGLKIAKGKYIAIMDADDISLPKRFEIQYKFLEKNKDTFLAGSGWFIIDENSKILGKRKRAVGYLKIKKILPEKNCMYNPTVMFRNDKNTFYKDKFKYAQDYDLWLRLLNDGKLLHNLPNPLIKYRINPNGISQTKRGKQRLFTEKAREFYQQRVKCGKDKYDEFNPNEILDIDVEKTINKVVLKQEVFASFSKNDFRRARKFCKKYFKNYGYDNRILIHYILTFTNKRFVNFLRFFKKNFI